MKNLLIILINTLRVTFRKRSSFIVHLLLPIGGVLLGMTIMSSNGSAPIQVGVVNHDGGTYSSGLLTDMQTWGDYKVRSVAEPELDKLIVDGKLDCGVIIPEGFSSSVLHGNIDRITIASIKGKAVTAALEAMLNQYAASLADISAAAGGDATKLGALYRSARTSGITLELKSLADRGEGKNVTLASIGFLILFVMLGAGITSQLILAEKQSRTYYRITSAPVKMRQYLAGNGVAGLLITMVQILVVLFTIRVVFHIDTSVPDILLFALLSMFGVVSVGIGMLMAAFSRSSAMAAMLSTLIITPTCMLAGCFVPLNLMPQFMQKLALIMPQHWVIDAITRLQSGNGNVGVNVAVLAAFALAFFAIAVYGFVRREESGRFV